MSKSTKVKSCRNCGSTEITRDLTSSSGDLSCQACGSVQEENPIVSEVQFGEASNGAAMVQGAMVGSDQARAYNNRTTLESREQTIMNAKQKIRTIAGVMRIPDYIVESACGWFKLALVQNFVQGRRSQNVIAACLYVACRHEKTHHLLIDFSSRLQISVYSLGATYLKLVRALQIQRLPLADPSLFIQHFAERLNFGDYTAKVCRDATKIASRMSSDWIYEGRRPAGIAGACLLLAARMNNFRRSHAEVVAVARVGEETLQKRLNEFKNTKSAMLSISEFRESSGVDDTAKPPSFTKNRRIEKKIETLMKQRRQTLETYRKLAKDRVLFKNLDILTEDGRIKSEIMAAGDSDDEVDKNSDDSDDSAGSDQEEDKTVDKNKSGIVDIPSEAINEAAQTRETSSVNDASGSTQAGQETEAAAHGAKSDLLAEKRETVEQSDSEEASENEGSDPKDTSKTHAVNDLFLPSDEDDAFDDLPANSNNADPDFESHHKRISQRMRNLRSRVVSDENTQHIEDAQRLMGVPDERKRSGRLEGFGSGNSTRDSSANTRAKARSSASNKREVHRESRQNELMKAVLLGGELTEEDLEIALDRLLEGHSKTTEEYLYKTPGDAQAGEDLVRRIELNRPRNLVKNNPTTSDVLSRVPSDELINSDEDDEEVDSIRLDEEERRQKEQIWIALNHDFLIAQEKKRLKIEADELTGNTSGQSKKRRKTRDSKDSILSDSAVQNAINSIGEGGRMMTPAESTKQMLQKKPFSKKINYDSIGELFTE